MLFIYNIFFLILCNANVKQRVFTLIDWKTLTRNSSKRYLRVNITTPIQTSSSISYHSSDGSTSLRPVLTGPDMAYLRSKVAFQCIAPDSSPPITYQLMKDGIPLNPTFTNLQLDQPARLSFKVGLTSEGSYHCEAKAGGGTGISNSIWLSVVSEY